MIMGRISQSEWVNEHYQGSGAEVYTMLQPLQDIHLHSSDIGYNFKAPGRTENIFIFSTIALFVLIIAVSNYINLIMADSANRGREAGIRKVLGADSRSIVLLIIGDFGKFVVPAIAISIPFAIIVIKNWMQNFAYRTEISAWIHLVSIGIALLVSLIAILVRVIRFAISNPADSLRYE